MSTHLPIRILRPLHRQCASRRPEIRPFSTSGARPARGNRGKRTQVDPVQTEASARHQGGKAPSTTYEEQLTNDRNLPDDIGLLPGTFIRSPLRQHLSELFSLKFVKQRAWYEWKWVVSKIKALALLWRFKSSVPNYPGLYWRVLLANRGQLRFKAQEKYKDLYQAFARGDSNTISKMCVSGVSKDFQKRIAARPQGLKMKWEVKGPIQTRVVSSRAILLTLPGYEDTGVHQVVVRIQSTQELQLHASSAQGVGSAPKYKPQEGKVVEYLVLQRQVVRGEAKDWSVWGFANQWSSETILEDETYERNVNTYQLD